jgi:hypothetical protein
MTSPDDRIRESLRDLIPTYQGPADPYVRVGTTIRRRRARQRVLVAIGSMAAVAAVAVGVPLALGIGGVGRPATGPGVAGGVPVPRGQGRTVAAGSVATGRWAVHAVQLSSGAHRCLHADDAVFLAAVLCFDDWTPRVGASWATVDEVRPEARVSAIFGVVPANVASITLVLSDRSERQAAAQPSPIDPDTRFFALVAPASGLTVRTVTTFAADLTPVQFAAVSTGSPPCRPSAAEPCTRPAG